MTKYIINGAVTNTVVLGGTPNYGSPLYIYGSVAPTTLGASGVTTQIPDGSLTIEAFGSVTGGIGSGNTAAGIGVDLSLTTTVTNAQYGLITGGMGTNVEGGIGVRMTGGGSLTNAGTITGGYGSTGSGGVGIQIEAATAATSTRVINSGYVSGGRGGVGAFGSPGAGGYGAILNGDVSLQNNGHIVGGKGGFGENQALGLEADNGARVYNGNASVYGLISGGVDLLATSAPGAYLNNAGSINGANNYLRNATGGWGAYVAAGTSVTNSGYLFGGVGGYIGPGGFGIHGKAGVGVYLNGGTVTDSGAISGGLQRTGTYFYYNSNKYPNLQVGDSVQFGPTVGGTLILDANPVRAGALQGAIAGFKPGDTIEVAGVTSAQITTTGSLQAGTYGIVTPADNTLYFSGTYAGESLSLDYQSGNLYITVAACFRRGTRLRTARGEAPIETLKIGDELMTMAGVARPIRWIGRRSYSAYAAAGNRDVLPVCIRAGALSDAAGGEPVPRRDLWVSPEHAMWLDGMLIPARSLVNGTSIFQEDSVADVQYIHVELDTHDVIYAESAPSESFVDDESRELFDNAAEFARLYPDAVRVPARFYAPRVEEGYALEAVRQRLAQGRERLAPGEGLPSGAARASAWAAARTLGATALLHVDG